MVLVLTTKQRPTNNIPQPSRNDTLPDIHSHAQARRALEDAERDETHVGDDVVQSQGHEGEDGPPHPDHFGCQVATLHGEEAGEADEPVAANAAQENLVKGRGDLLLGHEGDHFGLEWFRVEHGAVWADFPIELVFYCRPIAMYGTMIYNMGNIHLKMIAVTNNEPARFPQNVRNQCRSIRTRESRR